MSSKSYNIVDGTAFDNYTPAVVYNLLNTLMKTGTIVRIFYGDPATGICWNEEYDVIGRIGRSTGTNKIPLIVPPRKNGGPALLDDRILRIQTTQRPFGVLYQHPKFVMPEFTISESLKGGYCFGVCSNGSEVIARFESLEKAEKWVAFMRGERMTK